MKQVELVYNYMIEFGTITPLDAILDLGILRLGARIYDLRQQGIEVESDMITVKNRRGQDCRIAEYSLKVHS